MDKYTTRTDLVGDANRVDMGYHYPQKGVKYDLVVTAIGPGQVFADANFIDANNPLHDPNNNVYAYKDYKGRVFVLTAIPDPGYRVLSWTGTDNDPSWNINTNTVTLLSNHNTVVEFEPDVTKLIKVPLEYATIEEAMAAAPEHDTKIIVYPGTHYVTNPAGIDFQGKEITLISTNPTNPEVIASTVIECFGSRYFSQRAFHFQSGEGPNTVVKGFTIRGGFVVGPLGLPGRFGILTPDPYEAVWRAELTQPLPPRAERGQDGSGSAYGGGILCENASSPTIENCVITDCTVIGTWGGNGAPGQSGGFAFLPVLATTVETIEDGQWGGNGGDGIGYGYGGGIACRSRSCPIITNCVIKNNIARGGCGGNGGVGGIGVPDNGYASNGGNGGNAIGDGIGGAIYCENGSTPVLTNCQFVNNQATSGIPGTGAIAGSGEPREPVVPPAPIVAEGFDGQAFGLGNITGGAIYYRNAEANLADANCTFIGNRAYLLQHNFIGSELVVLPIFSVYFEIFDYYHYTAYNYESIPSYTTGGALAFDYRNIVTVGNCEFIGNFGGAVRIDANCIVDFDNCLFKDNTQATTGGAMTIAELGFVDINDCIFTNNTASTNGGAIHCNSDAVFTECLFEENQAGNNGGAMYAYYNYGGSDPNITPTLNINLESCTFLGNQAVTSTTGGGGGVYFRDFIALVNDCYFLENAARSGGGFHLILGDITITGGLISGNTSIGGDVYEMGGGLLCSDTPAVIENCIIKDNVAEGIKGSGGAISFYGGYLTHLIKNCLITGNSATVNGGAISAYLYATPEIRNSTFSQNSAGKFGGAVFCDWSSEPTIIDSIFDNCNSHAIIEEDIDKAIVGHSLFYNNPDGDYGIYDPCAGQIYTSTGPELDSNNIAGDPLFVSGLFGDYYLDQDDSPAVDSGSVPAVKIGLNTYTTDLLDIPDMGQVDIGYHYSIDQLLAPIYSLTIRVFGGHGTVEANEPNPITSGPAPGTSSYYSGTIVTLTATPEPGYRVARWSATDTNDQWGWNLNNIDVAVYNKKTVTVEFEPDVSNILKVPEEFTTIEQAVTAARSGDQIFVAKGVHYISEPNGIDFKGKSIILSSLDPDDPQVIAQTIIDCQGAKYLPKRALQFHSGEERTAVVTGFTIRNGLMSGVIGETGRYAVYYPIPYQLTNPDDITSPPKAERGKDVIGNGYGGAILCVNGSSPTIKNCVITDNFVTGAVGGLGATGVSTYPGLDTWYYILFDLSVVQPLTAIQDGQWGGDGGDGTGVGYGGAIACLGKSSPFITNCIIRNNAARGGWGGTGGPGGDSDPAVGGAESWGGNGGISYGGGVGGGIYCEGQSVPFITDCNFIDNFATLGPIGVGGPAGSGTPLGAPLGPAGPGADGYAYNYYFGPGFGFGYIGIAGGAVYFDNNSDANITNCLFSGNSAYDTITTYDSALNLVDMPLYTEGGALYSVADNTINLNNCDFLGNLGGAVYCEPSCILDIDNCIFEENSEASAGGAMFMAERGFADINDCSFAGNSAIGDGGAIICDSDADFTRCSFAGNMAGGNGGAIDAYYEVIDANIYNILRLNFESCGFVGNKAVDDIYAYGGAVYFQDFDASFTNCQFLNNTSKSGGGLFLTTGTVTMTAGIINGNKALGASGIDTSYTPQASVLGIGLVPGAAVGDASSLFDMVGLFGEAHWIDLSNSVSMGGGMVLADTHATLEDCVLQNNVAESVNGTGGAIILYGGNVNHLIKNCLLTGNSAVAEGGAIASAIYSVPKIQNCTFANNSSDKLGSAVYSDWTTEAVISDSIFDNCGNVAIAEEDTGGNLVEHCLFNSNANGDYGIYDSATGQIDIKSGTDPNIDPNGTNIAGDPLFVPGSLGDYYLDQSSSPAVDNGSDTAVNLGLDTYTTDPNGVTDMNQVDIGSHYLNHLELEQFTLTTTVIGGHGTVEPASGTYYAGMLIPLTAFPDIGYRVDRWSGTAGDASTDNTNVVVMLGDRDVTVEFAHPRTIVVGSDPNYTSIQRAIDEAVDGDIVLLHTGTYDPPYPGFPAPQLTITLDKGITISSLNPDDPACVAATIFDNVIFEISTIGTEAIIDGLTITHSRMNINFCSPTIRNCVFTENNWFGMDGDEIGGEDGFNGVSVNGSAMTIYNGSPVVQNCLFSDCSVTGGDGARGADGDPYGKDGGWAGWAYGGAAYIGYGSNPIFTKCSFVNCFAMGGNGGDGGNSPVPGHGGRGGNYTWSPSEETGPGTYPNWYWWDGWAWGTYDADGYPTYYGGYYKDYWKYSGHGGAVYIENDSNPQFTDCDFVNNHTYGGLSGLGGTPFTTPDVRMTIENFGGAVYACYGSAPEFTRCNFADNTADPSLDPNAYTGFFDVPEDVYVSYGGTIATEDGAFVKLVDCNISGGEACIGGGIYWSNAEMEIIDCSFSNNTAYHGAGMYSVESTGLITLSTIYGNIAYSPAGLFDPNDPNGTYYSGPVFGRGAGYYCLSSAVDITNSAFTENQASASGGAIYLIGSDQSTYYNPLLKNCLITLNSAGRDGGGISTNWLSEPIISNCTIADNNVVDVNGLGGGLYCSYESNVEVIDSIIWGNRVPVGVKGSQIAVATGGFAQQLPSSLTVSYSLVQGFQDANEPNQIDPNAIFVDTNCPQPIWDFNSVFDSNPLFVGGYYLSHIATGQTLDSRCIDAGSGDANDPFIDMAKFTTRIDAVNDVGIVDVGYHYPKVVFQRLTVYVVGGHGSVNFDPNGLVDGDPNGRTYNRYTSITIKSVPDPNYRVEGWYDVNDVLLSTEKNFLVVMDLDKVFKIRYELPSKTLVVPVAGVNAIQQAIDAAKSGDTLIVTAGVYDGDINLQGKDITIVCTNPDDPNIINSTIIDCVQTSRAFIFNSNEGPNTIIDGFTIINGSVTGVGGGAIYVDANSSPTIKNVVMDNCTVIGADGGAIYVDANSSPRFINCIITNCSADNGGAAHCDVNSSPIFRHCTFINNSAAQVAGAVLCDPNVSITIDDCNFLDNTAIYGGALYAAENCSGTIIDTILERNDANQDGGAMYLAEANDLSIIDCNMSYNTAAYGAGLYSLGSLNLTINRTSFNFNWAPFDFIDPNDPNTEVVGQGGGMYCFATEAFIKDCVFNHNNANTSGGGMYFAGESDYIDIKNCLLINNLAGRDGGGISANWYSEPNITNCTFVSNAAPGVFGQPGTSGFGGGLYCSYHSSVEVKDSILWNNYALNGYEIAVATGFEFDPRPSILMISYSDIKRTALAVMVDTGCTLLDPSDPTKQTPLDTSNTDAPWHPNTNNIDLDPLFVIGPIGEHYLRHIDAGQTQDSPCIDAGSIHSELAFDALMDYTTRTDSQPDRGYVDMGYHYLPGPEKEKCRLCDLFLDGIINFKDFASFAMNWLEDDCFLTGDNCQGADFTFNSFVDANDLAFFVECWLIEDVYAPIPNPSEWRIPPHLVKDSFPYSIYMAVRTSFDAWGWPVKYQFDCIFGDCHDSGWIDEPNYIDTGLAAGVYGYRVRARDVPVEDPCHITQWSVIAYAGTMDIIPPAPVPAIIFIQAVSPNSIMMIASEAFDESGVQYYFEALTVGGHDSGWVDEPNYTDVNLVPDSMYCYRVKARDTSALFNETTWSAQNCTSTPPPPDTLAPLPDPMQWDTVADANGYDGTPREIYFPVYDEYGAIMRAIDADDQAPPGVPVAEVEYYFQCLNDSRFDSGWRTVALYPLEDDRREYRVRIGMSGGYAFQFRVRARDASDNLNKTDWSPALPALP